MAEALEPTNADERVQEPVTTADLFIQLSQRFHNDKNQNATVEREAFEDSDIESIPCEYCHTQINLADWDTHTTQCAQAEQKRRENIFKLSDHCLIPCEYCLVPFTLQDLQPHMEQCTEAKRQRLERISNHSDNYFIPCEYCAALFAFQDLQAHMDQCEETRRARTTGINGQARIDLIPCEYCSVPIKIEDWKMHTDECAKVEEQQRRGTPMDVENDLIPCEICDEAFAARLLNDHQIECRRQNVASASGFPGQVFGGGFSFPETWDLSSPYNLSRYVLKPSSEEYKFVAEKFHATLPSNAIVQIERIQNRRWYRQYDAHRDDFIERHDRSTEQWLFHGCGSQSITSITNDCFNRSHAVRFAAGQGIYFATDAAISLAYTKPDTGNIRHMFMARVLVGRTTAGNQTTRVCPQGYDTTGGGNVFVTYHDAQAYGEYLIAFR